MRSSCGNDGVYTFKISGSLSGVITSALSIITTFTSLMKSIVTCSLSIITNSNIGSDNIECKVISNLSSGNIIVSDLSCKGITFSGLILTMSGNATCDGKSDDRGSDDNGIFIQFSKF